MADLPPFYRNILSVWQELHSKTPHNIKEMKEEILWNNRFIKIGGRSIFYKAWTSKGIQKLNELLDSNGLFFSFENFNMEYASPFSIMQVFLQRIPKIGKTPFFCYFGKQKRTNDTRSDTCTGYIHFQKGVL